LTQHNVLYVTSIKIAVNSSATPKPSRLALNIDLASVMQAGRWKTTAMPMRYGEDIQAGLGGMARTAKAQGRAK
jgi:hypothetical protein